jgi:excisionase family DNA binding protein
MGLNYMRIGEVASICGVSTATVRRWIKTGKLLAYRLPRGHYRIRREDYSTFAALSGLPMSKPLPPPG